MKNSLLILAGAAALSLASCSQEKTTDTTVAGGEGMTTTTTTTTTSPMSEAQIEARAQRIADKMVADMKITDEATKTKIRTVYVNRYRQMGDMQSRYTTDTTGMAASMREANMATDEELKTIFTNPTQYQAYEASRPTYYEMERAEPAMSSSDNMSSDMNATSSTTDASGTTGSMSGNKGEKVKMDSDGDIKIKDAQGNKTKVDGDDGTLKMKTEDGSKTKIK